MLAEGVERGEVPEVNAAVERDFGPGEGVGFGDVEELVAPVRVVSR